MKQIALSVMFLMLAACGGKNTDNYVGHWQVNSNKGVEFAEIKKNDGNYFLVFRHNFQQKNMLLSEKENGLSANNGLTEIPIKLSDDGKKLFLGTQQFSKVDSTECINIIAEFEEKADKLAPLFNKMLRAGDEMAERNKAYDEVQTVLAKYRNQCEKK